MPGLVISIAVEPGQQVKSGETVAIIEAMKMQNILRAERDGVVKAVGAKAGDPVAAEPVAASRAVKDVLAAADQPAERHNSTRPADQ